MDNPDSPEGGAAGATGIPSSIESKYKDLLSQYHEIQKELHESCEIRYLCPSLSSLIEKLHENEEIELCEEHCELALHFCYELSQVKEKLIFLKEKFKYDRVTNFTNRIILYSDEKLEIRVHHFINANETYIHDHQGSFISCCIQGSYLHKLYTINPNTSTGKSKDHEKQMKKASGYQSYRRQTGGKVEKSETEKFQIPQITLAQPFEAGQALFLSPLAYHTVTGTSTQEVLTITFRNKNKVNSCATIFSNDPNLPHSLNSQQTELVESSQEQTNILNTFINSLKSFGQPSKHMYEALDDISNILSFMSNERWDDILTFVAFQLLALESLQTITEPAFTYRLCSLYTRLSGMAYPSDGGITFLQLSQITFSESLSRCILHCASCFPETRVQAEHFSYAIERIIQQMYHGKNTTVVVKEKLASLRKWRVDRYCYTPILASVG